MKKIGRAEIQNISIEIQKEYENLNRSKFLTSIFSVRWNLKFANSQQKTHRTQSVEFLKLYPGFHINYINPILPCLSVCLLG